MDTLRQSHPYLYYFMLVSFDDQFPIGKMQQVWYFHRLCVPSKFLVSASLNASSLHDPPTSPDTFPHKSWMDISNPPIAVFCLWDNPLLLGHESPYVPLYQRWLQDQLEDESAIAAYK